MGVSETRPEDYGIRCSKCYVPYEPRKNFVTGKATWFPMCDHDSAYAQTVLKSEMYGRWV